MLAFLNTKTFGAFPEEPTPLDMRWEFRSDDGAAHGRDTYSFVSEEDYRLRIDMRWRQPRGKASPTMVVLRSPIEMLNCLRITDLPQVAGLLFPRDVLITSSAPGSYTWAKQMYRKLGEPDRFRDAMEISKWRSE